MHPVLGRAISQVAETLKAMDEEELQIHPQSKMRRWSCQQIAEHLILTYQDTTQRVQERLERRKPTLKRPYLAQRWIRFTTLTLGSLPRGVPTPDSLDPGDLIPQSGSDIARRLLAEAEIMDATLVQARSMFGIQPVIDQVFLGPLRVDQWRRYHAIHATHHLHQIMAIHRHASSHSASRVAVVAN